MKGWVVAASVAGLGAAAPALHDFTPDEVRRILQHSPLPAPPRDSSNARADDPAAAPRTSLHCECGAWLRPEVVWFGEPLDAVAIETAIARVEEAEVIIVVGTSSVVYPVAALPQIARRRGARSSTRCCASA